MTVVCGKCIVCRINRLRVEVGLPRMSNRECETPETLPETLGDFVAQYHNRHEGKVLFKWAPENNVTKDWDSNRLLHEMALDAIREERDANQDAH